MADLDARPADTGRDRPRHHPLRRRLRRRHAAHRRPVHQRQRAVRQRPGHAARLPGRDPGPGRHAGRRLGLPGPHLRPRHHHAGRRAERAGGHEPGRAAGRAATSSSRAARSSSTPTRSTSATSPRPATPPTPSTDGSLDGYTVYEVPMTLAHQGRRGAARREAPRRRALEELLRPRARVAGCTPGPIEPTLDWIDEQVRQASPQVRDGQPGRVQGRPRLRRDGRAVRPPATRSSPAHARRRARTRTSPATPRWPGASSPPASWPSCRCSSARYPITPGVRHPPRAVASTRTSACARCRPRTRSPASAPPSAPPSAATSASPPRAARASRSSRETIGLAVSLELPLLIIDIQRGGPSTGLPTKTEQADLLHGACTAATASRRCRSSPPYSPAHCFDAAIEAARIALKYRTPVILLSDGYLANGAEPWRLPDVDDAARHLGRRSPPSRTTPTTTAAGVLALPARPRDAGPARGPSPARPGLMHRIGGIEKEDGIGQHLLRPGQPRAHGPRCGPPRSPASPTTSPRVEVDGDVDDADLLVVGWGSHLGRHRRRGRPRAAPAAARWPTPTSCT